MFNAVLATIIVSLISLMGALLLFKKNLIRGDYGGIMISLAAGVMLTTAILDLLPEALEGNPGKGIYWMLLAGVCTFFIMERMIHWYHHHHHCHDQHEHKHDQEVAPTAYLILLGDGLHNFFDGLAIATAFSVSWEVGAVTTLAIVLHEIPQELADFVALVHSGFTVKKALIYNLISGFTAIMGTVGGWYFLQNVSGALPYLLAFNAGMFIYIACSDLIPALHDDFKKNRKWIQTFTFLLGVITMAIIMNTVNESVSTQNQDRSPVIETHLEAGN